MTSDERSPASSDVGRSIGLHCFGGKPAEPGVEEDVRCIGDLPPRARERLWDALGPSLVEPLDPKAIEARFNAFVKAHEARAEPLARVLRAARMIVRQAAVLDVGAKQLAEDMAALNGGDPSFAKAIMPGYESAKRLLRSELAKAAIADHGKVLEDIKWRVDLVSTSDRGVGLKLPVLMLTLHYRDNGREEQLHLQVLPNVAQKLRAVCDHLLGK